MKTFDRLYLLEVQINCTFSTDEFNPHTPNFIEYWCMLVSKLWTGFDYFRYTSSAPQLQTNATYMHPNLINIDVYVHENFRQALSTGGTNQLHLQYIPIKSTLYLLEVQINCTFSTDEFNPHTPNFIEYWCMLVSKIWTGFVYFRYTSSAPQLQTNATYMHPNLINIDVYVHENFRQALSTGGFVYFRYTSTAPQVQTNATYIHPNLMSIDMNSNENILQALSTGGTNSTDQFNLHTPIYGEYWCMLVSKL
ncbi:unnamed protein product [Mytilus edulis]|uniref:Uncharacterized protein n=1 Tax=Mytilus edulis TaxID=6550 RepID=A0A8S3VR06_MYTED|nr:unnamed protein product [Mytilus edulis]